MSDEDRHIDIAIAALEEYIQVRMAIIEDHKDAAWTDTTAVSLEADAAQAALNYYRGE